MHRVDKKMMASTFLRIRMAARYSFKYRMWSLFFIKISITPTITVPIRRYPPFTLTFQIVGISR